MANTSLPYHEPGIVTVLIQASFLLLLNVGNFVLDHTLYCGLLGQVFLGVAWGTPGAKWLSIETEEVIVQLGYLGLLLIVYEGGLSTCFIAVKANLLLSSCVAVTGISLPIGLSFVLCKISGATPLQSFAAGAALCSTSLGTTFTVLGSTGLVDASLGVVLTSAAMMDDVVGLVMVQIISNLGESSTSISAVTVVRPLLVSMAFAVCAPLICSFIARPATLWLNAKRKERPLGILNRFLTIEKTAWFIHTFMLIGSVAASTYAGTSNLFAAYIAGAAISWWDSQVPHHELVTAESPGTGGAGNIPGPSVQVSNVSNSTGLLIFKKYYSQPLSKVLKPFFFASVGFSIPITEMFNRTIIWKGLVYTPLMVIGKLLCGAWLLRISFIPRPPATLMGLLERVKPRIFRVWGIIHEKSNSSHNVSHMCRDQSLGVSPSSQSQQARNVQTTTPVSSSSTIKPRSIYPASIIGCAMTARGEIGFLISSIAETNKIFTTRSDTGKSSEIFLIVTWAITLCTILGPLAVGLVVRRVKQLQQGVRKKGRFIRGDVLGVWGIS
ncbi:Sodium/hydrogen exchanger [Jackrogersella minutella]|nr:Sodium/hydrogen exchanger [Jackrogersella minutella]